MSLLARLEKQKRPSGSSDGSMGTPVAGAAPRVSVSRGQASQAAERRVVPPAVQVDPYGQVKARIHDKLVREIDPSLLKFDLSEAEKHRLKEEVEKVASSVLDEDAPHLVRPERVRVTSEVVDEVMGYGPINSLLADPTVTEVMVNGPYQVYIERQGKLILTDVRFRDAAHVLHVIDRIVAPLGRRIDEASPMVDARLPDGSRVNAIIPPLSLKGPCITIRKFSREPFQVDDLVRFGTLTPELAKFLEACVKVRLNMVVSGGTGSGKTTTLNVLSSFIPADERIVTIEDAAELQLRQEHVVTLEARPPNIEGKGAVTIRDLVRNALRMRPDRIIVGEVRGGEALDMLQAMNTGHDGSLTTGHANSPRDMLARLETMVLMAGMELPVRAIREQIASAIDLIVHQARLRDGSRKVVCVSEVQGMEGDVIVLQDVFVFDQKGIDEEGRVVGTLRPTGIRPKFVEKFESHGVSLPADLFVP